MPDLIALRERALDLMARKGLVREAAHVACSARIGLTSAMRDHVMAELSADDEDEPEDVFRGRAVGDAMPLFTDAALHGLIGGGASGDFRRSVFVGNTRSTMAEIIRCGNDVPDISAGDEPDLSNLTPFEVRALVSAYRAAIEDMTADLRDAHTRIRNLRREQSGLPPYLRGACLGMFGGSDAPTRFSYGEGDFDRYNTVWEPILPGDRDFRDGGAVQRRVNRHPEVFSARFLAPFMGDEAAMRVEAALEAIERASAPRPGEPPTLTHFSSHATNRIPVDYAPGEVDAETTAPAPRP